MTYFAGQPGGRSDGQSTGAGGTGKDRRGHGMATIPGGEFDMGRRHGRQDSITVITYGSACAGPEHPVEVSGFENKPLRNHFPAVDRRARLGLKNGYTDLPEGGWANPQAKIRVIRSSTSAGTTCSSGATPPRKRPDESPAITPTPPERRSISGNRRRTGVRLDRQRLPPAHRGRMGIRRYGRV